MVLLALIAFEVVHDKLRVQTTQKQKQDGHNVYIYAITKAMCPPGYHRNGFVATHALGHLRMSCHKPIVITARAHCFHDCIYIYIYIYMHRGMCVVTIADLLTYLSKSIQLFSISSIN